MTKPRILAKRRRRKKRSEFRRDKFGGGAQGQLVRSATPNDGTPSDINASLVVSAINAMFRQVYQKRGQ